MSAAASATRASCCRRRSRSPGPRAGRRAAALDRGPAREPHRQRQLPRAPLHPHRLCRRGRPPAGARLRGAPSIPAPTRPIRSPPAWRPAQVASILPGLYDFPHYRCRAYSVATNKPPILPYRGVARTGVCFALEVTLDALARKLGTRAQRAPLQEPGAARADAVRQHRQAPLRLRRLPRGAAPGGRGHRPCQGARAPEARASPTAGASASALPCTPSRPATAPASTPPGASRWCPATSRRLPASRRMAARTASRRAQPRPGPRDHAVAGGARDPRRAARAHPAGARRHRRDALLHGHLGLALHDHGGRRRRRARATSSPTACSRIGAKLLQAEARGRAARRRRGGGPVGPHRGRRRRAHLVSPAAGPARRRRPARTRGHRRLQGQARHRHLQLCGARRRRRRRSGDRGAGDPRLRRGRGRRRAGQPHDRRRPDHRRHGAGHRHRALRGDALRRARPAAGLHALRLPAARRLEVPDVRIVHMETPSPYTRFGQKGLGEGGAIAPPAPPSPTPSTTRSPSSAPSSACRRSRRGASSRPS